RRDWLVEFFRDHRRDRGAAERDAARKNFSRLDEKQIGDARADIDQERTARQVAVAVTKRIVDRHGRDADDRRAQTSAFHRGVDRAVDRGLGKDFALAKTVQNKTAVWFRAEFRQPDGVRTEVKTKNARGGGHERTNPSSPFRKPEEIPNSKSSFQPLPRLIGFL